MLKHYNLGWLGDFLEDYLNYTKNSSGARVRYNPYMYHVEFVPSVNDNWQYQLLISIHIDSRFINIVRVNSDLSAEWKRALHTTREWPQGINQMPISQYEDEDYEFYIYTSYLLQRAYSLFV